jgi:hypothetical protein
MTLAIEVFKHRDTTIPFDYQDPNGINIDMTGYTLSGEIVWDGGGSLDITSMLSYLSQAGGNMQFAITAANASLLPDGAASNITVIGTLSGQDYYLIDNHPVYAISLA